MKTQRNRVAVKRTHNHQTNKRQKETCPTRRLPVKQKKNAKKNKINVKTNTIPTCKEETRREQRRRLRPAKREWRCGGNRQTRREYVKAVRIMHVWCLVLFPRCAQAISVRCGCACEILNDRHLDTLRICNAVLRLSVRERATTSG